MFAAFAAFAAVAVVAVVVVVFVSPGMATVIAVVLIPAVRAW